MLRLISSLLVSILPLGFAINCTNTTITHLVEASYPQYGERPRNVTEKSTIACSKIYSISQIPSQMKEANFTQILNVTDSNISTIHSMELHNFFPIEILRLSKLHIKKISPGAFKGLTKLKKLYLDHNELTEVPNGVYSTLHSLEILNMSNNQIRVIENVALVGLTSLKQLHLNDNDVTKIEDGFFETLHHLEYLDLSQNTLEEVHFCKTDKKFTGMYSNFSNLTINLSCNQISKIDFVYFPKTREINLSNNRIESIENSQMLDTLSVNFDNNLIVTFGEYKDISKISLAGNKIKTIQKTSFLNPHLVVYLDFSYNELTFDKNFFHDFISLTTLKLRHVNLDKIDTILFRNLSNLTLLDLSENRIREFQYGVFDSLINLEILNISGNKLLELHQYTFNSLSNLRELYFDNNQISTLDVNDLANHVPNLTMLSLDHNPWPCQELIRIQTVLKNLEILSGNSHDVENFHGIACANVKSRVPSNSSEFTLREILDDFQKLSSGVRNSKMEEFFNEDFQKSKFKQYFEKDYLQSDFFKYLNSWRLGLMKQENSNETRSEKFTSYEYSSEEPSNKILIFICIILVVMSCALLLIVYLIFSFLKKQKIVDRQGSASEMELC